MLFIGCHFIFVLWMSLLSSTTWKLDFVSHFYQKIITSLSPPIYILGLNLKVGHDSVCDSYTVNQIRASELKKTTDFILRGIIDFMYTALILYADVNARKQKMFITRKPSGL
jgi:hypothetical protein